VIDRENIPIFTLINMMSFAEIREGFIFSVRALSVNKLRTILSLTGVTIGIFAMISVFTVVDSLEFSIRDLVSGLGDDLVFVKKWPMGPEDGAEEYEWWKYFQRDEPSIKDMDKLADQLTSAAALSFDSKLTRPISYYNNSIDNCPLLCTTSSFTDVYPLNLKSGRFFTFGEHRGGRNVCVIGATVNDDLFNGADPIGRTIRVAGKKTTVIGLVEREGESIVGQNFDDVVVVPVLYASTFADITKTPNTIWIKAKEGVSNDEMKDEVVGKLRSIHRLRPTEDKDFSLMEISMVTAALDSLFGLVKVVALIIGMFSILVGGFGIANIMFVSVKERTKIIGIQKALGAKQAFILLQFLIESVALSVIGGGLALLLIWLLTIVLGTTIGFELVMTSQNLLLGLGISITIGVLAGIIPAWQASRLDPVEAIRAG